MLVLKIINNVTLIKCKQFMKSEKMSWKLRNQSNVEMYFRLREIFRAKKEDLENESFFSRPCVV